MRTFTYSLSPLRTLARETPPAPKLTELLKQHPTLQEDLDALIEDRLARAPRPGRGGVRLPAEIEAELTELREKDKQRAQKELVEKGRYDAALASLEEDKKKLTEQWNGERSTLLQDIRHDRCESQLVIEATVAGAKNPKAIAKLLSDRVDLDADRQTIVKDANGNPLYKGGKLVTVKDLVAQHRREEPWAYNAEGETVPEGSPSKKRGGEEGDGGGIGGDGNLDAQIAEAQKVYDSAHAAAMRSGAGVAGIAAAKDAKRKLLALVEQRDSKKK